MSKHPKHLKRLLISTSNPVQAASDVNSPVSGEVSAVNDALTDESSKVRVESPCFGLCKLHRWSSETLQSSWIAHDVCMRQKLLHGQQTGQQTVLKHVDLISLP